VWRKIKESPTKGAFEPMIPSTRTPPSIYETDIGLGGDGFFYRTSSKKQGGIVRTSSKKQNNNNNNNNIYRYTVK
jgi:hypothetical protein